METPIPEGEHAQKTATDLAAGAIRFVKQNTAAVVAVIAGVVLLSVLVPPVVTMAADYRPDCTIGYYGTTVNIELKGWRAGYECGHAVETIAGTYETSAQGTAICGRRWHNLDQTIRDSKPNGGWGVMACASLGITGKKTA